MSEIGPAITIGSLTDTLEQRSEASGYPVPGYEIKVVDPETGDDQPINELGEIVVRGYCLLLSYYKKPSETAACYDDHGWFHTGDTGLRRADGHIRFIGRYKDMLKVGGENVDPMEVEALLLQAPGVSQVAVVSYPDERLTEVPVAFVQREDGHEIVETDIIGYCRGKVATFKIPRHVFFVEDFPMTASGKIRKVQLRERALTLVA
jgi:fatty-acyl-CoA synthase